MGDKRKELNRRLIAYSTAAAAAIAIAPVAANAAVVYSGPQNLSVNLGTTQTIDLNNDGLDDFHFYGTTGLFTTAIGMSGRSGSVGVIYGTMHSDPGRLPANYTVQSVLAGPSFYWDSSVVDPLNGTDTSFGTFTFGSFNAGSGYLGVAISDPTCRVAYGWIQYSPISASSGTIVDWAYEDGCGPIQTGAVASSVVPTVNEWGMLALAGLLSAAAITAINREKEETA